MAESKIGHGFVDKFRAEIEVDQEGMKLFKRLFRGFLMHGCVFDVLGVCLA